MATPAWSSSVATPRNATCTSSSNLTRIARTAEKQKKSLSVAPPSPPSTPRASTSQPARSRALSYVKNSGPPSAADKRRSAGAPTKSGTFSTSPDKKVITARKTGVNVLSKVDHTVQVHEKPSPRKTDDKENRMSRLIRPTQSSARKAIEPALRSAEVRQPLGRRSSAVPRRASVSKVPSSTPASPAASSPSTSRRSSIGNKCGRSISSPAARKTAALPSASSKVLATAILGDDSFSSVDDAATNVLEGAHTAEVAKPAVSCIEEPLAHAIVDVPRLGDLKPDGTEDVHDSIRGDNESDVKAERSTSDGEDADADDENSTESAGEEDHSEGETIVEPDDKNENEGESGDGENMIETEEKEKDGDGDGDEENCDRENKTQSEVDEKSKIKIKTGDEDEKSCDKDDKDMDVQKSEEFIVESQPKSVDVPTASSFSASMEYHSESSSNIGSAVEDSMTDPSESSSFGSLVDAYAGPCTADDGDHSLVNNKNDESASQTSCSSLDSLLEAYSSSSSENETSFDDSPSKDASPLSSSDVGTSEKVETPLQSPVIPEQLVFHPAHKPEGFLQIPAWYYESRLSRRASRGISGIAVRPTLAIVKPLNITKPSTAFSSSLLSPSEDSTIREDDEDKETAGQAVKPAAVVPAEESRVRDNAGFGGLDVTAMLRDTQSPQVSSTSNEAAHALAVATKIKTIDEEFAEDLFLESLRWLYTSRLQLWHSEASNDDEDEDEESLEEDFADVATKMAARIAVWTSDDVLSPAVHTFRESIIELQATVKDVEEQLEGTPDKSTVSSSWDMAPHVSPVGSGPAAPAEALEHKCTVAPSSTLSKRDDQISETRETRHLTAKEKGKARETFETLVGTQHGDKAGDTKASSNPPGSDVLQDNGNPIWDEEECATPILGEVYLSYLPTPETPEFILGGTWTLAVLPWEGLSSCPSRSMTVPAITSARTSHATFPPSVATSPIATEAKPSEGPASFWGRLLGRSTLSSASAAPFNGFESEPPSPVISEASLDDGASSDYSGSPGLSGSELPEASPVASVSTSAVEGRGLRGLFSRWF